MLGSSIGSTTNIEYRWEPWQLFFYITSFLLLPFFSFFFGNAVGEGGWKGHAFFKGVDAVVRVAKFLNIKITLNIIQNLAHQNSPRRASRTPAHKLIFTLTLILSLGFTVKFILTCMLTVTLTHFRIYTLNMTYTQAYTYAHIPLLSFSYSHIQSVSKTTSLGLSNFLTDEREYCKTYKIHQRKHSSFYKVCPVSFAITLWKRWKKIQISNIYSKQSPDTRIHSLARPSSSFIARRKVRNWERF